MRTSSEDSFTLQARWVFPASSPPIEQAIITIEAGKIISIDSAGNRTADLDLENAAIIPGLVNAHTHLDLTGLRGKIPPQRGEFVPWLQKIIRFRFNQSSEQIESLIQQGIQEAIRYGTTLLGDIAAGGQSLNALQNAPLWSVCYREAIGLPKANAERATIQMIDWINTNSDHEYCKLGISPHAPYSVRRELFQSVAKLAKERHLSVAIHLAESPDELELLTSKTGSMVGFLEQMNVYDPQGLVDSFAEILEMFRDNQTQFVHANQITSELLQGETQNWVICPRTRSAFGFEGGPIERRSDQGYSDRIAIGTDSLASNPDLDPLAEIRFLHQSYPEIPLDSLLRMVTLHGAKAMGFDSITGSLEVGKSADLLVLELPDITTSDPHELIFMDLPHQKRKSMWRGSWRS